MIIHYIGNALNRPWYRDSSSRMKEEYYALKAKSPWSSDELYYPEEYIKSLSKHPVAKFFTFLLIRCECTIILKFLLNFRHLIATFKGNPVVKEGVE